MRLNKILTGLLLIMSSVVLAQTSRQDSLAQYYYKYPKQAIQEGEQMYQQAIREHNNPLLIKSLILKTTFALVIDDDKYPQCIRELEDYITQEKDINTKCILHSYVGQLYSFYYQKNRYKISRRTKIKGTVPANMNAWSSNLFLEQIYGHLWASIAPKQILQQTPISRFDAILTRDATAGSLRPTLYDFLCHRAINLFVQGNTGKVQSLLRSAFLLADAETFLKSTIAIVPQNTPSSILKIYQELLTFHQQSANKDAFLMANLERLKYARQISTNPQKDSLYLLTLRNMQKQYAANPMVIEIMADEAEFLIRNYPGLTQQEHQNTRHEKYKLIKEQALAICEKGLKQYPHYNRVNLLNNLIKIIKAPDIYTKFPKTIYPGDTLPIKITSSNLSTATISIYRIELSSTAYDNIKNKKGVRIPKKLIYQHTYPLPNDLIARDTQFTISGLTPGLLEVVIKTPEAKTNITQKVICTRLFASDQLINGRVHIQVCDWKSGKPVPNARILVQNKYPKHSKIDTLYTDAQGLANQKLADAQNFYEAINSENPSGPIEQIYKHSQSPTPHIRLTLITDRKIYRPGQTVYFKGIAWQETIDRVIALNNQTFESIFIDANGKEIGKQKVVTNRFGSFTGNFTIPAKTLNGQFIISTRNASTTITVADYKRPEFEISFTTPQRNYYTNDTICIKGKVSSFSGVNISNTVVKYDISAQYFYYRPSNQSNIQGSVTTDLNGEFEITFKPQASTTSATYHGPYSYKIKATVTDSKGETQESSISIPIYSGIAAPKLDIPEQVNKDKRTAFHINLDDVSSPQEIRSIKYSLSKLITPKHLNQPLDTLIEKTILEGQLEMGARDSLFPSLAAQPSGAYLFTAQCGKVKTDQIFYLYSSQDKRPPIPTYEWLVEEKTICKPGEKARIQFGTSADDAYVTYAIFTPNKLLQQKSVVLSNEILNLDIPYLAEYGNQIWVNIRYVKDKKYIETTVPLYRFREPKILNVQTTVFRDKLLPGQQEKWEIKVLSNKNKPVFAEVLAMMYDASLDKLMPNPVHIQANYLHWQFPFPWNYSYIMNASNYMNLSSWSFKQKTWPVPSLNFEELYLYHRYILPPPPPSPRLTDFMEMQATGVAADESVQTKANLKIRGYSDGTNEKMQEVLSRQNFQETAFFYPQLQTDSAGNVAIQFTMPESQTKWKFIALATTPSMNVGEIERYITTSKPLMVRPNLPRFLRSGDITELKASISNLSDTVCKGTSTLEFFMPENNQIIFRDTQNFNVAANQTQTLGFHFNVPENADLLGIRITAVSERFSDGEQNLLAVLPNETLITETQPIYMVSTGKHTYSLKNSTTQQKNYRLTLELTANPIWYAVLALPTLTEPRQENITDITAVYYVNSIASMLARSNPQITKAIQNWAASKHSPNLLSKLEQNQELKSILLEATPWVMQAQNETERMQTLAQLFDQNRTQYLQKQALEKLLDLQTSEGGWGWFKGMNTSRFMTINVLTAMARTNSIGQQENTAEAKNMQIKALRYLDDCIKEDYKKSPKRILYDQVLYLYCRSLYRDIPLGDALEAHKHYMSLAQKQWFEFSLYEKAILAITLKNYGFMTEAQDIVKSLRQYAVTTPESGMYWPRNKNSYFRNSAVQIHSAIMVAFQEIEGNSKDLNSMKQWLLRQKQVQNWESVPATVDAIHAILLTGNQLSQSEQLEIKLGQHEFTTGNNGNPLGYVKESFSSDQIKPNMLTVQITKHLNTPSWGGLYLQYFEKLAQVKEQKTDLSIKKELFVSQTGKNGRKQLIPLAQQSLQTGNQVVVRLTLSLNRDMEFLHLKDMRAACFEPSEQLSGNKWKFGTVYYQETKDAVTNFFFNFLSRGTYVLEYPVWINQNGTYQDGIATLQSVYAPEYSAHSNANCIVIKQE